jgi:hypothetical protein
MLLRSIPADRAVFQSRSRHPGSSAEPQVNTHGRIFGTHRILSPTSEEAQSWWDWCVPPGGGERGKLGGKHRPTPASARQTKALKSCCAATSTLALGGARTARGRNGKANPRPPGRNRRIAPDSGFVLCR